jgi:sugar/nucleoside kinase (ribokinase family)
MKNNSPALFVGISTLDIAYLVDGYPEQDTKTQATDQFLGTGGPASNAAITFAALSGRSPMLLTALGRHYLADVVRADLREHHVLVVDSNPESGQQPPISSIIVASDDGSRTIVSLDASRISASFDSSFGSALESTEIVLVDGHYGELALGAARQARRMGVPVVFDGGRWKATHDELLGLVDVAICSSAFSPPGVDSSSDDEVLDFLHRMGPSSAAITRGSQPVVYSTRGGQKGVIPIPAVPVVDTLGAGDIFHGAFCHYFIQSSGDFVDALSRAVVVASDSCRYFGTRQWMDHFLSTSGYASGIIPPSCSSSSRARPTGK